MTQGVLNIAAVLAPLLMLLAGLAFTVAIDSYILRQQRRIMLLVVVLSLSLIVQNFWENALSMGPPMWLWRTAAAVYGYCIRPVILLLFIRLTRPKARCTVWWILVGVNAAIYMTAFFSHLCFWIDEKNHYKAGPLSSACFAISIVLLVYLLLQAVQTSRAAGKSEEWIPIIIILMIFASIFLDYQVGNLDQPVAFLTIAIVISSMLYYVWLHLQFVREHEEDLMAEQRIRIMISQIQPHFLYNTIATICALCRRNPDKAAEVAGKFGGYLRQNLSSLNDDGLIPVEKELEHTRLYADIEMVRFENVRVEYDIEDNGFMVPPLTIQPLVENAIRHGVRIREEGIVRVSTFRTGDGHEIRVEDNGIGFDAKEIKEIDSSHIGIRNVTERIDKMCGGTLQIDSRIGEGTVITIRLPAPQLSSDN